MSSGIKLYFEDLEEDRPLECRAVAFTREAIVAFAAQFDPQPFHLDEAAARDSIFKGLVASALHTLSACTKVVVAAQAGVAILSGVGLHAAKMYNPVRPGGTLSVDARWADLRRSRSKPDRGFASILCNVANQSGQPVVSYGYQYLVAGREFKGEGL
jgi:acyl dehydratase